MKKMPEFLKYSKWYIENKDLRNKIGSNEKRYKIKKDAPNFIKKATKNIWNIIEKNILIRSFLDLWIKKY